MERWIRENIAHIEVNLYHHLPLYLSLDSNQLFICNPYRKRERDRDRERNTITCFVLWSGRIREKEIALIEVTLYHNLSLYLSLDSNQLFIGNPYRKRDKERNTRMSFVLWSSKVTYRLMLYCEGALTLFGIDLSSPPLLQLIDVAKQ